MQTLEITKDIHWVGVLNTTLRAFDVVFQTRFGSTYNSYLIQADKPTLIDCVHEKFDREYLEKLRSLINLRDICYIVVNHTEMDHTGALGLLLKETPNAQILATKTASLFLKNILHAEVKGKMVEDGECISLGNKQLKFIHAPYWHWPDTMFTYLEEEHMLFSCDGFATHFCDERLFDDLVDDFAEDFRYYFEHVMGPYRKKILEAIEKIKNLDIRLIAPSHGPILRTDPWKYINAYKDWSTPRKDPHKKLILVLYASMYGNTKKMAEAVARGASTMTTEVKLLDAANVSPEFMRCEIESAEGILIGSSTINGDALMPLWNIMNIMFSVNVKLKKCATFGTYGWSGEATRLMEDRLKGLKLHIVQPPVKVLFTPTEEDLKRCSIFGYDFAQSLTTSSAT
ncbi:MAG: FprA family A-type flavoprotein [Candidatus Brocadia sp. AMX2]|uniref:Flavodoxin/nitric oxide synthase n=1 Tax=Candidatus Brocadia sinica JPN1 TaxID=1197129 RepID=A0ABQ0JWJ4_9BACT|nr:MULTISPECIES: FprA family A-type flavoprotein [Brocadia]KXK29585.1 MAG: putative flavoprotein [Candidatus Brocadia sinica]MBC6931141.1 FprA family A-type flavoprotein [Candidatus Brocadia sp.]MBL1167460.1 FprA family A-type flavoprotein [Candidatus Brocadia sp. AMX1]NOG41068.1 FprA family A-type flavoprotein [Planctomycetota bacterium]KAA0244670.1 MAG: FprA family A-type flavoprotein [Candidatus Brocadia sp. AMX2]